MLGDRHPPLYFLLVWCVARFNASDIALRLPSALAAAAAAAVVYRIAARSLGTRWGWAAALLLGLSPFTLCYAASARSGTLTILLGAWMVDATLRLMTGSKPRRAAWELGLAAALGLYSHYAMVLALGGCLAGLWCARTSMFRRQLGSIALVAGAVAFLPWVLLGLSHQSLAQGQHLAPLATRLGHLHWPLWPLGPSYLPMGGAVLLGLGLVGGARALGRRGWRGWLLAWLGAALIIPWAWNGDPSTAVKYYLYAPLLPGCVLLAVVGMRPILRRGWLAVALAGLLWLPALHTLWSMPSTPAAIWPPDAQGVFDHRLEATALASLRRTTIAPAGQARVLAHWQRTEPELGTHAEGRRSWTLAERHAPRELFEGLKSQLPPGCVFEEAFSAVVAIHSQAACQSLRAQLATMAQASEHGPFLLEAAVTARDNGELDAARQLAEHAARVSPVSARPELLLVAMLGDSDPLAALDWGDRGLVKALRSGHTGEATRLARLRMQVVEQHQLEPGPRAAQLTCLTEHGDRPWKRLCRWAGASMR